MNSVNPVQFKGAVNGDVFSPFNARAGEFESGTLSAQGPVWRRDRGAWEPAQAHIRIPMIAAVHGLTISYAGSKPRARR